jgi:nicotinate-nucleotide--dimethylbenzimidazole phosphoribosyltransferase
MAQKFAASLNEIRALVHALLPCKKTAGGAASNIDHPRIVLFAAAHGVSADMAEGRQEMVAAEVALMLSGAGEAHARAAALDCDLRLYELALDRPTRDSRYAPAMNDEDAAHAAAYGMMAVEPGVDLLSVSALGRAADIAAAALGAALFPGLAASLSGEAGVRAAAAVARHRDVVDPLELLARLGGADLAAILGVVLASRLAGVPLLLDGVAAHAAAAVAYRMRPDALDHCRIVTPPRPAGTEIWERLAGCAVTITAEEPPPLGALSVVRALAQP